MRTLSKFVDAVAATAVTEPWYLTLHLIGAISNKLYLKKTVSPYCIGSLTDLALAAEYLHKFSPQKNTHAVN
jgi:hypothetical protein